MKGLFILLALLGCASLVFWLKPKGAIGAAALTNGVHLAPETGGAVPSTGNPSESTLDGHQASMPIADGQTRQAIEASAVNGPADSGPAARLDETQAVPDTVAVTFDTQDGVSTGLVFFMADGEPECESVPIPETGESPTVRLRPGLWTAFLRSDGGAAGPASEFEVATDDLTVTLLSAESFDASLKVIDYKTGELLSGVPLDLSRTDLSATLREQAGLDPAAYHAISNSAGLIEIAGIQSGTYDFTVEYAGYDSREFTLPMPGEFQDQVDVGGKADLGELKLDALTPFLVKLEGIQDWGGADGFFAAHTHSGDKVSFDTTGLATLQLGWFSEPLYLKLWYPGEEQEAIVYLDGGMPPQGEPWIVDVSVEADLMVDLRINEQLLDRLDLDAANLRVTTVTDRGDSFMQAIAAEHAGVFTFRGVAGSRAMVEFIAPLDGKEASLGLERVLLVDGQDASCVMNVESSPTRLQFLHVDGTPFTEGYVEFRELDNATGWAFGSPLDASGHVTLTIPSQLELSMRFAVDNKSLLAVDRAVTWEPGAQELPVVLSTGGECTIKATSGGAPAAAISFETFGAHSSNGYVTLTTDDEGVIRPFTVVTGSTLRLRLQSPDLWMPHEYIVPVPGTTRVAVYRTGVLTLAPSVNRAEVVHVDEGRSLASWIEDGLIFAVGGAASSFQCPCGLYRVVRDGESVWEGVLEPEAPLLVDPAPR